MENSEEKSFSMAMQLATASVLPMVLKAAIELDLLHLIKKSGSFVSPADLAAQIPAANLSAARDMIGRVLRLLATHSVLNCRLERLPDGSVERLYSLGPVCEFLTRNEDGASMSPMVLMIQDRVMMESWYYLKDAILEGVIPFNKAYGVSAFEYMRRDQRLNNLFNQAMSNPSTMFMKKILETYDGFQGMKLMVDVGGGIGATLNMIISKYPEIKGINFDLPHVVQHAPSHSGVEHVGGDMFISVPRANAIFMKWICHDWDDEHCIRILKNCYEALPQNGKVILAESVLPEGPSDNGLPTKNVVHADLLILAQSPGGKERTENEFRALAKWAGFHGFKIVCSVYNSWIIEIGK